MEADETKSSTWAAVRYVDGPGSEFGGIGSVGGGSEAVCWVATSVSLQSSRWHSSWTRHRWLPLLRGVGTAGRSFSSVASPACRSAVGV